MNPTVHCCKVEFIHFFMKNSLFAKFIPTRHQPPTQLYVFGPFCFLLLDIGANHGSVNIIHFSSLRHLVGLHHLLSMLLHLFIHTVSFISLECNCFIVNLCQSHNNYPPCQTVFPTISSVVFFFFFLSTS